VDQTWTKRQVCSRCPQLSAQRTNRLRSRELLLVRLRGGDGVPSHDKVPLVMLAFSLGVDDAVHFMIGPMC